MEKRGYNVDGTRIKGTENEEDLFGTVQLQPEESALKMSYKDIVKQTDLVVEEMLDRQSGRAWAARTVKATPKPGVTSESISDTPGFSITKHKM